VPRYQHGKCGLVASVRLLLPVLEITLIPTASRSSARVANFFQR
jgi:hypothetical protein